MPATKGNQSLDKCGSKSGQKELSTKPKASDLDGEQQHNKRDTAAIFAFQKNLKNDSSRGLVLLVISEEVHNTSVSYKSVTLSLSNGKGTCKPY